MSGIIGVAGSRSGIIDHTEIDYEEGSWTPTGTNVAGAIGVYTKIGDMVFLQGWFRNDHGSSDTSGTITGLPFTSQLTGNGQGGGFSTYQNSDTTNKEHHGLLVANNNTEFYIYNGSTLRGVSPGDQMHFNLSYKVK